MSNHGTGECRHVPTAQGGQSLSPQAGPSSRKREDKKTKKEKNRVITPKPYIPDVATQIDELERKIQQRQKEIEVWKSRYLLLAAQAKAAQNGETLRKFSEYDEMVKKVKDVTKETDLVLTELRRLESLLDLPEETCDVQLSDGGHCTAKFTSHFDLQIHQMTSH